MDTTKNQENAWNDVKEGDKLYAVEFGQPKTLTVKSVWRTGSWMYVNVGKFRGRDEYVVQKKIDEQVHDWISTSSKELYDDLMESALADLAKRKRELADAEDDVKLAQLNVDKIAGWADKLDVSFVDGDSKNEEAHGMKLYKYYDINLGGPNNIYYIQASSVKQALEQFLASEYNPYPDDVKLARECINESKFEEVTERVVYGGRF